MQYTIDQTVSKWVQTFWLFVLPGVTAISKHLL